MLHFVDYFKEGCCNFEVLYMMVLVMNYTLHLVCEGAILIIGSKYFPLTFLCFPIPDI